MGAVPFDLVGIAPPLYTTVAVTASVYVAEARMVNNAVDRARFMFCSFGMIIKEVIFV